MLANHPKISVVIPAKNCLEYLQDALVSIDIQCFPDLEILVVDDGSDDGTWVWLNDKSRLDPRLRPLTLSGVGPAAARNYAINAAKGDYIAFLDADDVWYPGKLSCQYAYHLSNPDIYMSFLNYRHISTSGDDLGDCFSFWPAFRKIVMQSDEFVVLYDPLAIFYAENIVGTSTVMVQRDALSKVGGFDESIRGCEDWDLWLRIAFLGPIAFNSRVFCDYLVRPGSDSRNAGQRVTAMELVIHKYAKFIKTPFALRCAQARLLIARAEMKRSRSQFLSCSVDYFRSFLIRPNVRVVRSFFAVIFYDALKLRFIKKTFSAQLKPFKSVKCAYSILLTRTIE